MEPMAQPILHEFPWDGAMKKHAARPILLLSAIFLSLIAVRVPFYLTHHVQEDAYITMRCAENLAQTGVYGFNPGERMSASTSHLHTFLEAIIHLVVGKEAFVVAVQVVNTLFFLCGVYFIARLLMPGSRWSSALWVMISLLPVSLMISYSGMETSLLIFMLGWIMHFMRIPNRRFLAWIGLALIPWVRPDAVAFALILVFWYCVLEKKLLLAPIVALVTGIVALLCFNQLYFGILFNQSITAKAFSQPPFSIVRFLGNLQVIFAENVGGIFNPIRTKFFEGFGYLFLAFVTLGIGLYSWTKRSNRAALILALAIASMIYLVPSAYAVGGVIYPWYMWPSTLLAYALLSTLVMDWIAAGHKGRGLLAAALIAGIIGMLAAQWAYSYNWGMKEYAYRGGIGKYLASISELEQTMFLEPAGYIPYYSSLYTYDEVGLASPVVLQYREDDPQGWWMDFVMEIRPDWLVQRGHIALNRTYQDYEFTPEEQEWLNAHYSLVNSFTYQPETYTSSPLLLSLLDLGVADDYYIYRLNP